MYTRIFNFGKVSLGGKKKIYPVSVEANLSDDNVFTCSARVYNATKTDYKFWGQCLDVLNKTEVASNFIFKNLYRFWKLYHRNDMHVGTPKQEKFLNDHFKDENYTYVEACKVLDENNLLVDSGYEYGSSWLKVEIPDEDLALIKSLLAE